MYLLTVKNNKDEGAYAVQDSYGHKVLFLFEEEDDAERYSIMIVARRICRRTRGSRS